MRLKPVLCRVLTSVSYYHIKHHLSTFPQILKTFQRNVVKGSLKMYALAVLGEGTKGKTLKQIMVSQ
jgi:hypothetical protein